MPPRPANRSTARGDGVTARQAPPVTVFSILKIFRK
jgi:hypothetical protein